MRKHKQYDLAAVNFERSAVEARAFAPAEVASIAPKSRCSNAARRLRSSRTVERRQTRFREVNEWPPVPVRCRTVSRSRSTASSIRFIRNVRRRADLRPDLPANGRSAVVQSRVVAHSVRPHHRDRAALHQSGAGLGEPPRNGHRTDKLDFWLNLFAVVAAIFNTFVHSRDAYATMPSGVWLSAATVALIAIGRILKAVQTADTEVYARG